MSSGSDAAPVLEIEGLSVGYAGRPGMVAAASDISLTVAPGQIVALVGESGSGKSTVAHAVAGLLPASGSVGDGRILLQGRDITRLGRKMRAVRGRQIGFVPQDPMMSLDPVLPIGRQVIEVFRIHGVGSSHRERTQLAVEALRSAGFREPEQLLRRYPHELSGGMRQRVLIGIALALDPPLIIADEPTTALDATVQRRVLDFIAGEVERRRAGLLLITHDLGLAADYAAATVVMSQGRIVEAGPTDEVIGAPRDPYTRRLLESRPSARPAPAEEPGGKDELAPTVILVENISKRFRRGAVSVQAVEGVSFDVRRGETVGLVGESGSGKSTVARMVMMLERPDAGTIRLRSADGLVATSALDRRAQTALRRRIQLIYQNPYASLDPKMTVAQSIREPLDAFSIGSREARKAAVAELLDRVALPAALAERRPAELSGGQRQRVAIARALALSPEILVCDEPVSALDVTVQAQILDLLRELQRELELSVLFISHDLAVVRALCRRVLVMQGGRVVEQGPVAAVFDAARQDYTRELLAAIPGRA